MPLSSSSPEICFLVFSFLIYNPFFLLLFLFEVSPLSIYVLCSSVVWFLLSLTRTFLLLPVLTHHLIGGHPFMTSTWRGKGVRLRWTHVDGGVGGPPHVDVH